MSDADIPERSRHFRANPRRRPRNPGHDAGNEVADDTAGKVVGTLYMRRSALNGTIPQTLTVTIKE